MRHLGKITSEQVEGWGEGFRTVLQTWDEDGVQDVFQALYLDRKDADDVLGFWMTGGARMVHLCASLEEAGDMGAPDWDTRDQEG